MQQQAQGIEVKKDLASKKFGRLTAVRYILGSKWECVCVCGNTVIIPTGNLLSKVQPIRSCGCLQRDIARARGKKWRPHVGRLGTVDTVTCCHDEQWHVLDTLPLQVSTCGRVADLDGTLRSWRVGTKRYPRISLIVGNKKIRTRIHLLVLTAFVGPRPEGTQTRHLNGDCTENHLSNLRWGTAQENSDDRIRHGTSIRKLRPADVLQIRQLRNQGRTLVSLGIQFGVNHTAISKIERGESWKYLQG